MERTKVDRLVELINEVEKIGEEIGVYQVEIKIGINAKKNVGFKNDKYPFYAVADVWRDDELGISMYEKTVNGVEMFAVRCEGV